MNKVSEASRRLGSCLALSRLSRDHVARLQNISMSNLYAWTNPKNTRFPSVFQLDRLCQIIDADCTFVITGAYENQLQKHLASLDPEVAAAAKSAIVHVANMALKQSGPPPRAVTLEAQSDGQSENQLLLAKGRLKDAVDKSGMSRVEICHELGTGIRALNRWLNVKQESFPDCFTFVSLCEMADVTFSQIIGERPREQNIEWFLSRLSRSEMALIKEYSATIIRSVYRL